jgi:hypothetical protein
VNVAIQLKEECRRACHTCAGGFATIEFGNHTEFAGQRMWYACAKQAFRKIIATTPEPDVRDFTAGVRQLVRLLNSQQK